MTTKLVTTPAPSDQPTTDLQDDVLIFNAGETEGGKAPHEMEDPDAWIAVTKWIRGIQAFNEANPTARFPQRPEKAKQRG